MSRRVHMIRAATGWLIGLAATSLLAAQTQIEWELIRPGNTGILGDDCWVVAPSGTGGGVWVSGWFYFFEEGGFSRYDPNRDTWTAVTNVEHPQISSPRFFDIVEAPDGVVWAAGYSSGGLIRYDPSDPVEPVRRFDELNSPLPGMSVNDVALAPDGTVWVAVDDLGGISHFGGIAQYDPAGDTWNVWTSSNGGLPWAGYPTAVLRIAVQDHGDGTYSVWADAGGNDHLVRWDGTTMTWFDPANPPAGWSPLPVGLPGRDADDPQGGVWFFVTPGQMARLGPDNTFTTTGIPPVSAFYGFSAVGARRAIVADNAQVYVYDGTLWQSLGTWGGSRTYGVAQAANGDIWVSGRGGAARYRGGSWQRYRYTNTGLLGYFAESLDFGPDGRMYCGDNGAPGVGGFSIYDGQRWTCVNDFNYGLGPDWGLPSDSVSRLSVRSNGNVLLVPGEIQGALEWDGQNYTYLIPQGVTVHDIVEDGLGRIWATRVGGTIHLWETDGTQHTFNWDNTPEIDLRRPEEITVDPFNPGWIYTWDGSAVIHTDGATFEVYPRELLGLTTNSTGYYIEWVEPDADGTLWVGSGRGLYHFNPVDLSYVHYDTSNAPLPSNWVKQIERAPDGTLWLSTWWYVLPLDEGGLVHFDKNNTWEVYTIDNSPVPHHQTEYLESRSVPGGYELWVAYASEAFAVLHVSTDTPGDVDGDGDVDLIDLSLLLDAFGTCSGDTGFEPAADFDGSGCIDLPDLAALLGAFG